MSEAIIVGIEQCQFVQIAGKWVITQHKRPGEMWRYFLSESGTWMVGLDMRAEFDSEHAAREFARRSGDRMGAEEPNMQDLNSRHDPVYLPAHYTAGKIEVWDFIADQRLNFCLGNVVKYVCRADHKGKPIEDLEKAVRYLQKELSERRKNPDCRAWDEMKAKDAERVI